jgi:hypothetical protein
MIPLFALIFSATALFGELFDWDEVVVSTEDKASHAQVTNIAEYVANSVAGDMTNGLANADNVARQIGALAGLMEEIDNTASSANSNAADAKQGVEENKESISALDKKVDGALSFVFGDDVFMVVTNYFGTADDPKLEIYQNVKDGGTNYLKRIWAETTRWDKFLAHFLTTTNSIFSQLEEKADRAFGYYDSHTGNVAPDNFLSVSAKNILLGAGGSFEKVVTSSGAFFVLASSDPTVYTTTTNGFLSLKDGSGTPIFEYVKGDKRLAWAKAGTLRTENRGGKNHLIINYKVESDEHPNIEATVSLEDINWISQTEPECPVTATWTGESGDWYVDIVYKGNDLGQLFVQATYYEGGESYIKSSVPQQINNIYLGDKSYRLSIKDINGVKVLGVD